MMLVVNAGRVWPERQRHTVPEHAIAYVLSEEAYQAFRAWAQQPTTNDAYEAEMFARELEKLPIPQTDRSLSHDGP